MGHSWRTADTLRIKKTGKSWEEEKSHSSVKKAEKHFLHFRNLTDITYWVEEASRLL